jgi:predicted O-methyltransferase YrrM
MSITQRNYGAGPTAETFSLNPELLETILDQAKPMGHSEDAKQLNLGFGFVYYGLVRALRPKHVLVIGSGYGFSVVCLALGLKDNRSGELTFVDPSYSLLHDGLANTVGGANFWHDPQHVREHFAQFGVADLVTHHKMTSAEFFNSYKERQLPKIDLAFIDGNHAYRHVEHDVVAALRYCRKNSYLLLHDTNIYIRETLRHAGVKRWLKRKIGPRKAAFEYVDFPFASGVALVRVLEPKVWRELC